MSELASIAEEVSTEASPSTCPICSFEAINVKKLKTHILLKHPKMNLCLFCVEKKGWSDNFVSQASYNQHYKETHEGIINKREKIKEEDKLWKKQERARVNELAEKMGKPPPKRLRKRYLCSLCHPRIEFESSDTYERHLIAEHGFDYCQICFVIGPTALIRVHILEKHSSEGAKLGKFCCYICCGSGPIFTEEAKLSGHLLLKHNLKGLVSEANPGETTIVDYPCYDCDLERRKQGFPSLLALKEHLSFKHEPPLGQTIRAMKRQGCSKVQTENEASRSLLPPFRKVVGIANSSGYDCFSISVLHLLAQTDFAIIVKLLENNHSPRCQKPSCLVAHFMNEYISPKTLQIDSSLIFKNYKAFGLEAIHDVDCGDFLRGLLFEVGNDSDHNPSELKNLAFLHLEWKFECSSCKRFMAMSLKDYVMKIKVNQEQSLEKLISDFTTTKKCPCGQVSEVEPSVKHIAKYIFIEIDRSIFSGDATDDTSKELRLFSLQLQSAYTVLGKQYAVLGTVNYMVDNEDGGHYLTYLLTSQRECIKVHETEFKAQRRKPDFDTDTVLVALVQLDHLEHCQSSEEANLVNESGIDSNDMQ